MKFSRLTFYRAFTLVEILAATAILALLVLMLLSMSNQAGNIWQKGEKENQHRQRARLALNFLGRELTMAALPIKRDDNHSLHFQINSNTSVPATLQHPDTLFFQAPIADEVSQGKITALGYFVGWKETTPILYRLSLGASDSRYISDDPNTSIAAIDFEEFVFLENVLGFWVTPYDSAGNALSDWDSRVEHSLPSLVKIDLLLVDARHALRITEPVSFTHESINDPQEILDNLPRNIRPGVRFVSFDVRLDNSLNNTPATPFPTP